MARRAALLVSVVAVVAAGVVLVLDVSGVTAVAVGAGGAQLTGGPGNSGFSSGGKVLTDLGGTDDVVNAVAVRRDGKIVAAGYSDAKGSDDFALVRYTPSGKLDAGFGSGGKVLTDLGTKTLDEAEAVAVQADGKIIAAGWKKLRGRFDIALVRYTTKGKLDAGFGSGGKVLTDLGGDDQADAVAVQRTGRLWQPATATPKAAAISCSSATRPVASWTLASARAARW